MLDDSTTHRLLTRGQVIAVAAGVLIAGGLALWLAIDWFEGYTEREAARIFAAPAEVAAALATQLRVVGVVNAVVLGALALYLGWYAATAVKTESAESAAKAAVRGLPVRVRISMRVARWLLAAAGVLVGLGAGTGVAAWHIADRIERGPGPVARSSDARVEAGMGGMMSIIQVSEVKAD
jgi:hypothetical protein